jgi:hypothetical protein
MRVAVIVVLMSVAAAPSEASTSCMSQAEARQHFPALHLYWHGKDHCWDATPAQRHQIHQVQRKTPIRETEQEMDRPKIDRSKWRDSMSAMLADDGPAQSLRASRGARHQGNDDAAAGTPWKDRWVDIETSPLVARWVDIAQVTPPPIVERKAEPWVTLRGAVLVLFAFVLTLATIEVLFRGTINERPRSREDAD